MSLLIWYSQIIYSFEACGFKYQRRISADNLLFCRKYIFVDSRGLIITCLLSEVELAGPTLSASANVHGKYWHSWAERTFLSSATKKRNIHRESLKMSAVFCLPLWRKYTVRHRNTHWPADSRQMRSSFLLIWVAPTLVSFLTANSVTFRPSTDESRPQTVAHPKVWSKLTHQSICKADREIMKCWMIFFLIAQPGWPLSVFRNISAWFPVCCREAELQLLDKHKTLRPPGCTFYWCWQIRMRHASLFPWGI